MIAAGSLFTSCVTNTEPQGIKDLREAKANYLDALANLRAADAELVKAQAAYKQAEIALVDADAAFKQALIEKQKLLNEAQAKGNEQYAAEVEAEIAKIKAHAEIDAVKHQKILAEKQQELEETLRKIAAEAYGLTQAEKDVLEAKVKALQKAQYDYNKAYVAYFNLEKSVWELENIESNPDGAGFFMTKADYEDEIADAEKTIAKAQTKIAETEAMMEEPSSIEKYLKAYEDSIFALRQDTLKAKQALGLYEVTTLKEASKAYNEAWTKFKKDSVGDPAKFTFKQESTLLDATYGLDEQFVEFVKTYATNGFVSFDGDKFTVKADKKDDYKAVEKDVKALKAIVEALNRDQVIIDNIADSLKVEDAKANYEKADSTYKAHYAILKAGLEKYGDYKLANDTLKMFKDTLKAAQKDSIAAAKKLAGDTAVVLETYPELVKQYTNAVLTFVTIAESYNQTTITSKSRLMTAVSGLGNAQEEYIGRQDSVEIKRTIKYNGQSLTVDIYVAFSDLTDKDFVLNNDLFDKILNAANCDTDINEGNAGGFINRESITGSDYNEDAKLAFDVAVGSTKKDTIDWFKNNATYGAYGPFVADAEALDAAEKAYDAAATKVAARKDSVDTVVKKFNKIGKDFWADARFDAISDDFNYQIVWSDKTFSEPSNCVIFDLDPNHDTIKPTDALKVALDGIDGGTDYVKGEKDVNNCSIFFGPKTANGEVQHPEYGTEFSKALYAKQLYEALADNESRVAQLANINKQIEALDKAFTTAKASFDKDNAAYVAGFTRLTGKKPSDGGKEVKTLEAGENVKNGKWDLAGKQLELANQFAPEYPGLVKEADAGVKAIKKQIDDTQEYINFLEQAYLDYVNLGKDPSEQVTSIDDIKTTLNTIKDAQNLKIDNAKKTIESAEYAISQIEAGYDNYTVALNFLKGALAQAAENLERYKTQLEIAQKEYDEVIAAYGVKAE